MNVRGNDSQGDEPKWDGTMQSSQDKSERVRMQIPLSAKVAELLGTHAAEMDRSQAWLASWALGIGEDFRDEVGKLMTKRLVSPKRYQDRVLKNEEGEIRLQVRVHKATADWLAEAAEVTHSSPGKFAALVIDVVLENNPLVLAFMKSPPGRVVRRWLNGDEDFTVADVTETETDAIDGVPRTKEGLPDERKCA